MLSDSFIGGLSDGQGLTRMEWRVVVLVLVVVLCNIYISFITRRENRSTKQPTIKYIVVIGVHNGLTTL